MVKESAGVLMFRRAMDGLEVLLVHTGGPFWANKEEGAWSIPKGELAPNEDPLAAAQREFEEETGVLPAGDFIRLDPVRQTSGKIVHAWGVEGDLDPATIKSNTFSLEWPPGSGREQEFPEVDRAAWLPVEEAKRKMLRGQTPLLDQLVERLGRL
jgi:predicted NUDIX family NTP pyrophosphohydrolase